VNGRWHASWEHGPLAYGSPAATDAFAGRAAAFLDRDGVINEGVADPDSGLLESPLRTQDVRLLTGVPEALRELVGAGYALVCVSNQPAAAKGKASLEDLLAVHERVLELLAREGVRLHASRLCPHHPQGVVPELSGPCRCRKPQPGMFLDVAGSLELDLGQSWMVGDTDTDVAGGNAAGCHTVLVEYPGSAHKRCGASRPDRLAANLAEGVVRLLDLHTLG
jgi:D-glycero-D-manno-heptose 1,7-bisphosphate phosphatase